MNFDSWRKLRPMMRVNAEIAFACHYCEDRGLRFCIDFGYVNAIERAAELIAFRWEL